MVWAAKALGGKIADMVDSGGSTQNLRDFLEEIYNKSGGQSEDINGSVRPVNLTELAGNLRNGVPMATPVFDGATEEEIKGTAQTGQACSETGQAKL